MESGGISRRRRAARWGPLLSVAIGLGLLAGHRPTEAAGACTILWDGGAGTQSWHDPLNWNTDMLPGASDHVCIQGLGDFIVLSQPGTTDILSLLSDREIQIVGNGVELRLNSAIVDSVMPAFVILDDARLGGVSSLAVTERLEWRHGTMDGPGTTTVRPGAQLLITGPATKTLSGGRTIVNGGTGIWNGGDIACNGASVLSNTGSLTVDAAMGGRLAIIVPPPTTCSLENTGMLTNAGPGTFETQAPLNSSGTVQATRGTIQVSLGGTATGPIFMNTGAFVVVDGNACDSSPMFFNNIQGGWLQVNRCRAFVQGSYEVLNTTVTGGRLDLNSTAGTMHLTQTGGALGGSGAFNVTGASTWTGGTQDGTGTTTVAAPNGGFDVGGMGLSLGRHLRIDGTATLGGGNIVLIAGGSISVGGTMELRSIEMSSPSESGGKIDIMTSGTLERAGAGTTTTVGVPIVVDGRLIVSSGTLTSTGGGRAAGSITVAAGAAMDIRGSEIVTPAEWIALAQSRLSGQGTLVIGPDGRATAGGLIDVGTLDIRAGSLSVGLDCDCRSDVFNLSGGRVDGAGTLNVRILNWSGGTMADAGLTVVAAGGQINATGSTTLDGRRLVVNGGGVFGGKILLSAGGNITIAGPVLADGGSGGGGFYPGGGGGGSLGVGGGGSLTCCGGAGSTFDLGVPTTVDGTLDVTTGFLRAYGGGGGVGGISVAGGASLELSGGDFRLAPGSSLTGPAGGRISIFAPATLSSGGLLRFDGRVNVSGGRFDADCRGASCYVGGVDLSGTLGGDAIVTLGSLDWTGGSMTGPGLTIVEGGTLFHEFGHKLIENRTVELRGTADWTGGDIRMSGGAVLLVASRMNVQGALLRIADLGGGPRVEVRGTLEVRGGAVHLEPLVLVRGTAILRTSAVLTLSGGGALAQDTDTDNCDDCTIVFGGSDFTFEPGSRVLGRGTLRFEGGTATVQTGGAETAKDFFNVVISKTGRLHIQGDLRVNGDLTIQQGTLDGPGNATVNQTLNWSGGTQAGLGKTTIAAGARLEITGPDDKTLGRTIVNHGSANWRDGRIVNIPSGFFDNRGQTTCWLRVAQPFAGSIKNSGYWYLPEMSDCVLVDFENLGTVRVEQSATLSVDSLRNYSPTTRTLTGGTYDVTGTLRFTDAEVLNNEAVIILREPGSRITDKLGNDALRNLTRNTGRIELSSGAAVSITGPLENRGTIVVDHSILDLQREIQLIQGQIQLIDALRLQAHGIAIDAVSHIEGTGRVVADVRNEGTVRPGSSPGALTIEGGYTHAPSGILEMEIGGRTAGTQFDHLAVTGAASLAGNLVLSTINGFVPAIGDTFTILSAGSVSGRFDAVHGDNVGNLRYVVQHNPRDVTLVVRPPDTDGDGVEDPVDNCPAVANPDQADLDADGAGDACDDDIDGDFLTNEEERARGTDPRSPDTDGDGLSDGREVIVYRTDPLDPDTDGDLHGDGTEIRAGSDPTNPFSVPTPAGPVTLVQDPPLREIPVLDDREPLF